MLGSIFLSLALIFSIISMIMYFLNYKGYSNTLNYGRLAYHGMSIMVILASTFLFYILLTHQYSYHYVYSYSSNDLSGGILAATFWAGQEGSFMLWLLLTSIVGIFLQSYTSKRGDLEPRVMAVYTLATTFLLVMVTPWFKSPFNFIWAEPIYITIKDINPSFLNQSFIQSFLFSDGQSGQEYVKMTSQLYSLLSSMGISVNQFIIDGRGLNPQLLNFWMQIHPPILFTGFSMSTVPFAFAVAALMKNDYKDWVRQSLPWVLAGAGILGLGIMLGGYWAYEMLGWGGYWAWDPVENSSLIPWLVGVASIHTLLVQKKSQSKGGIGKFAKTNLILCLLTYVLVLYSTFLTRSGVLGDASVHSFVDPGMIVYLFLVVFIGTFIVLGFGMLAYRWKYLSENSVEEEGLLSRELALFTAAIVLSTSALIVLVGTSAPLFGSSVDTFFYDEMHIPIAIIIGILNGLSLLLKWKNTKGSEIIKKSTFSIALSIVFTALAVVLGKIYNPMMILLTLSTAFAMFVNLDIAIKIIRGNKKMLGAYIAHIGIAIFILGVIGSAAYSKKIDLNLVKNKPQDAFGYHVTFTGYNPIENGSKYAFKVELKKDDEHIKVAPVMYISEYNNGLMREPAIITMLTKDIYVSPLGYDEEDPNQANGKTIKLNKGASIDYNGVKLTFLDFNFPPEVRAAMMAGKDFKIGVKMTAESEGKIENFDLTLINKSGERTFTDYKLSNNPVKVTLKNLNASGEVEIILADTDNQNQSTVMEKQEVLSISASIKPFISLVWSGVLVMVFGFFISVARRLKDSLL